jgi:uncharacterized protein
VQLTRETSELNLIRAWEGDRILIGDRWVGGNLILSAERIIADWAVQDPRALGLADLDAALALKPEIILVGTGEHALLPDTELMSVLAEQAIGLEFMTTPAACRTYNVLVHEQRRVVAVLFNTSIPLSR